MNKEFRLPCWLATQLLKLENAAICVLREAANCSDRVVVLTNAGENWVEHSGRRFLPRVLETLVELEIPVVSAQVLYADLAPGNPAEWKRLAFAGNSELGGRDLNLISIGAWLLSVPIASQV
jgi:hypothetical protein